MSSMATNSLRTSLRRAASCARYSSTQASSAPPPSSYSETKLDVQPRAELPADKMRVLVGLYHQSQSFVTKANLSEKIDEAFIYRKNTASKRRVEESLTALQIELDRRRRRPKFGQMAEPTARPKRKEGQEYQEWSDRRSERETQVFRTLYGVFSRAKPAYDALMDDQTGAKEVEVDRQREKEVEKDGQQGDQQGEQKEQGA